MNKKKVIIYVITVIMIITGCVVLLKYRDKSNYKLMLLNKYNITETKYNELKKIGNKTLIEIEKQNMEDTDIYYAKESNFMIVRGSTKTEETTKGIAPMDLKDNSIYLEVTEDNVKTFKPEDTVALTERASTYYTTAFNKAKNDTEHKDFIYFESIDELKDIIKQKVIKTENTNYRNVLGIFLF